MIATYRSLRLSTRFTTGRQFSGYVALWPSLTVRLGKRDLLLGGVIERDATFQIANLAVSLSWGGAWSSCALCGCSVNDQFKMRLARLLGRVLCSACADAEEDAESEKFRAEVRAGRVEFVALEDDRG